MEYAIEIKNLSKRFPRRRRWWRPLGEKKYVEAVKNVSLGIPRGELFGLLGPNGAGKTTLVKCLATLLLPDEGTAKVMGYDINKEPLRVRQCIGFTTGGERSLYWKLSARNNLRYFGVLYGMPQERLESRIDELLQLMELKDVEHTRLEKFSHGMRQKVNIARALLHDPPVLLLDEPTLGLDPGFSRFIRRFIKEELNQRQGKTILLTTHYMEEAEQLCDRVAIIDLGEIASVDTPEALKAAMPFERIMQLVVEGEVDDTQLMGITGISPPRVASADGKCTITIQGHGLEEAMDEILGRIRRSAKVLSIRVSEPTLEDVFVHLTGSKLSEPGEGK